MIDDLDHCIQSIQSDTWIVAWSAAYEIATYGRKALPALIPLLSVASARTRNTVALALREIADEAAVEPLVQAIRSPLTAGSRGCLVYALQTHPCEEYFLFLFNLTLTDTYEVQNHALTILAKQTFWYDLEDLDCAQKQLDQYASSQDRDPDTDGLIGDLSTLLADLRDQAARGVDDSHSQERKAFL